MCLSAPAKQGSAKRIFSIDTAGMPTDQRRSSNRGYDIHILGRLLTYQEQTYCSGLQEPRSQDIYMFIEREVALRFSAQSGCTRLVWSFSKHDVFPYLELSVQPSCELQMIPFDEQSVD